MPFERKLRPSKIPGLVYEISGSPSTRYFQVIHTASGRTVVRFHDAPVLRVSDFYALADAALRGVRWNVPVEKLNMRRIAAAVQRMEACVERRYEHPSPSVYSGRWKYIVKAACPIKRRAT